MCCFVIFGRFLNFKWPLVQIEILLIFPVLSSKFKFMKFVFVWLDLKPLVPEK